jgi:uncharacterized lipoprotein YajG
MLVKNNNVAERKTKMKNYLVTVISIWSKWEECKDGPRSQNFTYEVAVRAQNELEALEEAFCLTNMDNRPHGRLCCATTAGDVMVIDSVPYLVAGNGFEQLTAAQFEAVLRLGSRDTSFGLAFMVKHCGVPAAA